MERAIGSGVMWLGTTTAGALYGRFLPAHLLTAGVTGALVALIVLYLWALAIRRA